MTNQSRLAVINYLTVVAPHLPYVNLKGRSRDKRIRLSWLVYSCDMAFLRHYIPNHLQDNISIQRRGGWGGNVDFTSVECAAGLRPLINY